LPKDKSKVRRVRKRQSRTTMKIAVRMRKTIRLFFPLLTPWFVGNTG
jgi:hypothetical protein